jgi:hypothetical protein
MAEERIVDLAKRARQRSEARFEEKTVTRSAEKTGNRQPFRVGAASAGLVTATTYLVG